jgi:AraC-like DNA-binding protein
MHANRYPLGARSFLIELDAEIFDLANAGAPSWQEVWHGRGLPAAICLALHHRFSTGDEPTAIELEEVMVRLFEQIRGKRLEILKAPDRIARVRDQILESIGSPPTLRDLAAEADLHPAHLCRAFRRQYGCAMGDLLRRARIERAVACLENPESGSLSKIAFALGFCDQAHLTRQFRQFIGVPPGTFRRLRCKHDSIQGSVNPSN